MFARWFLFLLHVSEYLRDEYSNYRYHHEQDDLASSWEEYSREPEYCSQWIHDDAYLSLCESELHEAEVEVCRLVSLHRILPWHDACGDDIDKVYHIDTEDWECCCDLTSSDYCECRDEECEHDSSWVTHNHFSRYVRPRQEVRNRDDDGEEREKESAILLACECLIGEDELDREESEYDKRYQSKSTRKSWNSIREVHRVKNEYIPEYRYKNRDIPYLISEEDCVIVIQVDNITKKSWHIRNLDARESDEEPNSNLHHESDNRRDSHGTLPDSIHIVDEAHERYTDTYDEDDEESLLEERRKIPEEKYKWCEQEEHHEDRYTCSIWCRSTSLLGLIEVWSVEESEPSE